MKEGIVSLWNDAEASACADDLALRVYTSRLLGRDSSLVLHGGGNTSVKIRETNRFGEEADYLYVKGSGSDLATIEPQGFTALRLAETRRLADLETLSDSDMAAELLALRKNPVAPAPSVEAILHALLPWQFVDHTHADAFIAVSNTPGGSERLREIYGDDVVYIPYIMPGFDLAKLCARLFPEQHRPGRTVGMALEHHGLFSFGDSARESYERMIDLTRRAEDYLRSRKAWNVSTSASRHKPKPGSLSALRKSLSETAGCPLILSLRESPEIAAFLERDDLPTLTQQGPATPDHVIRTKRLPMLGRDVAGYANAYKSYFQQHAEAHTERLTMLDAAPRVILDRELGFVSAGKSRTEADIVGDIYEHTMTILARASALGGWQALPAADIFAVEYWELEQAKLRKGGPPPVFQGEVALVTGAASGIGRACAEELLRLGACVAGLDRDTSVKEAFDRPEYLGLVADVTDSDRVADCIAETERRFGGIDILVLNAGIFPPGCKIADLPRADWFKVIDVNLHGSFHTMQAVHPYLLNAPNGGRVAVIGSKNVSAPGPGAAAYSASKAAVNQLARVAALEWATDGIRVNTVHPNAVFDTRLWTEEVLQARAKAYGLSVAEYKTNNLLRTEITSRDVARLVAVLCGPAFAKTTGAQVPIDGGNERVI
jgi:rhamnose utilization protein RhaD (predicted bifunctional aldolase and dehydrogenase)/NAD(P)-dependent dehydrogenase (short-subunit alcohol dehydrogenase family)